MKKLVVCTTALLLLAAGAAMAVDVSGAFTTETRANLADGGLDFNQEYGTLSVDQQVDDNLYCKATLGVRYFNNPIGASSLGNILAPADLVSFSALFPLEIGLEEAYFSYTNFILNGLDLSVGKQRIPWGAADNLNPTDLLNPLDFSDPLSFGKRSASVAVSLTYSLPVLDSSLQLVYEPYSQVARLNSVMTRQISDALYAQILSVSTDTTPTAWSSESVETPAWNLENYLIGARLAASVWGFDLSVSYINRLDDIPYVKELDFDTDATYELTDRSYILGYYREQEIGFDMAKDLGFVLAWGEASVVLPAGATTTVKMTYDGTSLPDSTSTLDPYVKYTVGASQKIGPFYFNLQYNHGFFHERGATGAARLQDYAVLRMELSLLSDKLTIGATGIGNVNTLADAFAASDAWTYIADNYGVMGGLDLKYSPTPSMSFSGGVMLFDGTATTTLGAWKDNDIAFVKFSFVL